MQKLKNRNNAVAKRSFIGSKVSLFIFQESIVPLKRCAFQLFPAHICIPRIYELYITSLVILGYFSKWGKSLKAVSPD